MTEAGEAIAIERYRALQRRGRQTGRRTDELLQLYALEGLLARLALSPDRERLILKGGMLLAAFDTRRPTRDIDLQGQQLHNDVDDVRKAIVSIATISIPDGLVYDTTSATAQLIRDDDAYWYPHGSCSSLRLTLSRALPSHVHGHTPSPAPPPGIGTLIIGGTSVPTRLTRRPLHPQL